jgi:hypothetical protein
MNNIFPRFFGKKYINKIYNKDFKRFKNLQKKLLIIRLII